MNKLPMYNPVASTLDLIDREGWRDWGNSDTNEALQKNDAKFKGDGIATAYGGWVALCEIVDRRIKSLFLTERQRLVERIKEMKKTDTFPQQLIHLDHSVTYLERLSDGDIHYNAALTDVLSILDEKV
ncbi:MAG: hypothetical protein ACYDAK_13305 [Candidatus Limnocylindrales bacterium]